MYKLKAFVGLDNKFVLCEKFPDDQAHGGLDEMLQEFLDSDDNVLVSDAGLEIGLYELEFVIEDDISWNPESSYPDAHLVLQNFSLLKTM
jgi:hypothetical protein